MKKLFLLVLVLSGCTTMKVTYPDGRVVETRSQDPVIVSAIVGGVTAGALSYLKSETGLRK